MIPRAFGRWEGAWRRKEERKAQDGVKPTLWERVLSWFGWRRKVQAFKLRPIADARREIHWLHRKQRKLHGSAWRQAQDRIGILQNRIRATEV